MSGHRAKTALVTGASSGIGQELARIHASRGGDLVLVARREDRLQILQDELEDEYSVRVTVLCQDLSVPAAAREAYQRVSAAGIQVDYLINSAGFAYHGFFHKQEKDRVRDLISVNVTALTELTRCFLPDMFERGTGRILNMASMAAFLPGPLMAVYYATKAYVLSFSEAIANELSGSGVTVTVLCPGGVRTEFVEAGGLVGTRAFRGRLDSAHAVALQGYNAMLRGQPVVVDSKLYVFFMRFIPRRLLARFARIAMENA
jgi:hypothetical protein